MSAHQTQATKLNPFLTRVEVYMRKTIKTYEETSLVQNLATSWRCKYPLITKSEILKWNFMLNNLDEGRK